MAISHAIRSAQASKFVNEKGRKVQTDNSGKLLAVGQSNKGGYL